VTVLVLTWGGLRGGTSVALALSLPKTIGGSARPARVAILTITSVIVVFSIPVPGLSIGPMTRRRLSGAGHIPGAAEAREISSGLFDPGP
jgi:CPA1 family monovalent cation:H+ antiporter